MKISEIVDFMQKAFGEKLLKITQTTKEERSSSAFWNYYKHRDGRYVNGSLKEDNFYKLHFHFENNVIVCLLYAFCKNENGERLGKLEKRIRWYLASPTNCFIRLIATDLKLMEKVIDPIASIRHFKSKKWEEI